MNWFPFKKQEPIVVETRRLVITGCFVTIYDTDMMDSPLNKVADGLAEAAGFDPTDTMMSNCQIRVVRGDDGKLTASKLVFPPREDPPAGFGWASVIRCLSKDRR